jgi:hypothetical protein
LQCEGSSLPSWRLPWPRHALGRAPKAADENAFLKEHSWQEDAGWFLGLTEGAAEETKGRYAFVYGDFRRLHRSGLIACVYRAAEWWDKQVERAAYRLLQELDAATSALPESSENQ